MSSAKRAALYARVSTTQHGQDPEVQLQELRRFATARGWRTVEVADHGFSGGTDSRPGLKNLMAMVRRREVDVVVVVRLDRLFRSTRHLLATLDELVALGVDFVSLKEAIDLTTPAGKLLVSILGALGEFERDLVRERVQAGVAHARSKGKRIGRPTRHDPGRILALRAAGRSYRDIARITGAPAGVVSRVIARARKSCSESTVQHRGPAGEKET